MPMDIYIRITGKFGEHKIWRIGSQYNIIIGIGEVLIWRSKFLAP